ncbi:MAG: hypothetical protein ACPGTP_08315 [Bacteroidia bacterium]
MKRYLKSIKKSTIVLMVLLVLNILTFYAVSSRIKHNYPSTDQISTVSDNNTYFKAGVNVLDWSYTLLKYFRR